MKTLPFQSFSSFAVSLRHYVHGINPVLADTMPRWLRGCHSLLLRTDGSLWSMGRNDRGQLGNGSELEHGLVGGGDGDATDSSGNGNDGMVNGATLTTAAMVRQTVLTFDGVNDYIQTHLIVYP